MIPETDGSTREIWDISTRTALCISKAESSASISRGAKTEPRSKLDEIEACGVVAFEDQERMYVPVIFATPKNSSIDMHLLETQLWLYVKNELSEYEQPVAINVLSSLPMTPSGKIDYQTLEKMRKLETLQSST